MKVKPSGDFEVSPSENITFTVKRKNSPCIAAFDCQGWQSCTGVTSPDPNTKVKTCKATSNSGDQASCTITVDFHTGSGGTYDPNDQYTVTITGSQGGSFTDTFTPPPVLNGGTYNFVVE